MIMEAFLLVNTENNTWIFENSGTVSSRKSVEVELCINQNEPIPKNIT
jgi:hypothetical protein